MNNNSYFITGIGTGVGKTIVSAILASAIGADYWKPVQAGTDEQTDSEWIQQFISLPSVIHPEVYRLKQAASPHIAANNEKKTIDIGTITNNFPHITRPLIIEGAGGLLVPLNGKEFVIDLIKALNCKVILVSRNYLGSINHSLLTARVCREAGLTVAGWIFNDRYLDYEEQIAAWSGYPKIATIPKTENINTTFITTQAASLKETFSKQLC
jgi:dethiobiotin synthetase